MRDKKRERGERVFKFLFYIILLFFIIIFSYNLKFFLSAILAKLPHVVELTTMSRFHINKLNSISEKLTVCIKILYYEIVCSTE